mmetsp:Transcript_76566/g.169207  ORF Transcript_76566/g.169207 Transcript_76566/m.169207 type:complete len:422 (+) Transcript_76566:173-1438(+)
MIGSFEPLVQDGQQLSKLFRRWHFALRRQAPFQHLMNLLDSHLGNLVLNHKGAISAQPCGHLWLNLVHKNSPTFLLGLVWHHSNVNSIQQRIQRLSFPLVHLLYLLHGANSQLLASFLQLAFRLFPKAFVVNPIGVDRIGPLTVNEEITNLIEDISIRFQHIWLDQELLLLLVLCLILQQRFDVVQKILCLTIDNTSTKKAHVRWLHKKLIPALCHDLLQDFPSLEAILHMDGVNHRNACLGALLHVARLVHDPFIVIPHGVVSSVRVLLNLLYPPGECRLSVHQGNAHVAPEVESDVVLGQSLLSHLLHGHKIHMENVRMQPHDLEACGHIRHKLTTPSISVGTSVVFDLQLLRIVAVLRSLPDGVKDLAMNDANADLETSKSRWSCLGGCFLHGLCHLFALLGWLLHSLHHLGCFSTWG